MIAHIEFIFQSEGWKSRFSLKVDNVTQEQINSAKSATGWRIENGFTKELWADIDDRLAKALGYDDLDELTDIHEENCDVDCAPSIEGLKFFEECEYDLDYDRESVLAFDELIKVLSQYVGF